MFFCCCCFGLFLFSVYYLAAVIWQRGGTVTNREQCVGVVWLEDRLHQNVADCLGSPREDLKELQASPGAAEMDRMRSPCRGGGCHRERWEGRKRF